MDPHLKLVTETGTGCLILRDLRGCYVVRHRDHQTELRGIATLAGAYASCRWLEPALAEVSDAGGRGAPPAAGARF